MTICHYHFHHPGSDELLEAVNLKLERLIKMSETLDQEISDIGGDVVALTAAVNGASAKFSDLAAQLAAALEKLKQQGVSPEQLALLEAVKTNLTTEASALTAAAQAADPDPVVTPPAGDDSVSAPTGDDSVTAPSGDDSITGASGDDTTSA